MDKSQLEMSHVDYDSSFAGSLWGTGDKVFLDVLAEILPVGTWADIGAGDGRYVCHLLKTCSKVVAFDNDPRALAKLQRELPEDLRARVECREHDITGTFNDVDEFYDGLFSAATTHIFSEAVIFEIAKEYLRIVRPGGRLVLDMLGDIWRIKTDGDLYVYPGEINYSTEQCKALLKKAFSECKVEIVEGSIVDEPRNIGETAYKLNATQVIAVVEKTKR